MAISINYRGDVKSKYANAAVQWLKTNKKLSFVEWCPTGLKVGINEDRIAIDREKDIFRPSKRSIVMVGNNTAISRVFTERVSRKYDLMYSQKAFVHWYIREGMEELQFLEAREDLECLEKDYLECLQEDYLDTDETDEEEQEI